MAGPNIVSVSTLSAQTAVQQVSTTATAIVTNSASSGRVIKINALYVSNVDGTNNADINVAIQRNSTDYHIAKTVVVPADATLDVVSKALYLEEGDALRLTASANSDLEAVCSFEQLS